ncbi:hypothetical protein SCA6_008783 [Theobroma cacao]
MISKQSPQQGIALIFRWSPYKMLLWLFKLRCKVRTHDVIHLISELQVSITHSITIIASILLIMCRDVLKWTQPMDDVVIDVLLHQQSLGNRVDKVFTTMAYENMGRGGFAWGLDTKMWTAKPELWKALAKSKPDSKKWMTTRISNYDKLLMLFANDREKEDGAKGGQWTSSIGGVLFDGIPLQDVVGLTMEDNDMNDTSQVVSQVPSQSATSFKGKK